MGRRRYCDNIFLYLLVTLLTGKSYGRPTLPGTAKERNGRTFISFVGCALATQTGLSDIYSTIKALNSRQREPYFDITLPTKVSVKAYTTAVLSCRVYNLGNFTVSWLKHKDLHILSVGRLKYTSDNRYKVIHRPNTGDFQLHINYVQPKDAGVYECQISTKPISEFYINLMVTEGGELSKLLMSRSLSTFPSVRFIVAMHSF